MNKWRSGSKPAHTIYHRSFLDNFVARPNLMLRSLKPATRRPPLWLTPFNNDKNIVGNGLAVSM